MSPRRLEHGTPQGYDRGCTRHEKCPALPVHGLTCETAHIRFESGERRYMTLYGRNMPAAAIARRLGFTPPKPSADAIAPEDEYPIGVAPDVEEAIARYAARKEAQQGTAPTTKEPTVTENEEPNMSEPTEPTEPTEADEASEALATADAPSPESPSQATIRAWARKNGIEVNPKGNVWKGVVNAYRAAHATSTTSAPAPVTYAATEGVEPVAEEAAGLELPAHLEHPVSPEAIAELNERESRNWAGSDLLDETRRRLGDTVVEIPGPIATDVDPSVADASSTSRALEQARSIAARLEAENAMLVDQLGSVSGSLEFTIRQWALAVERLDTEKRAAPVQHKRRMGVVRHLIERLREARLGEQNAITESARLDADLADANTRIAALTVQLEQAQEAAQAAAALKSRRFFGGAR